MAAKRRRSRASKKKVTVHLDAALLRRLAEAIEILAAMSHVIEQAADDAALRRELLKKVKGAKGRRKK